MEKLDGREQAEAEILKQADESVKSALKEARTEPAPPLAPAEKPHIIWFWPYLIALAGLALMVGLWQSPLVAALDSVTPVLERFTTAAIIVTLVLAIQRA